MPKLLRHLIKSGLCCGALMVFFIFGAKASLFGEENAVLGKILLEDMQQTLHLKDIISFATDELNLLNQKYGYERWINKGLDEVKDYGFLQHIKTDDFVLGSFQYNMGNVGFSSNSDDYTMDNLDQWIDQVWGKSPQLINSETKYPGTLAEWQFQSDNNLPGFFLGSSSVRSMVNRENAELSYKHALWNMAYNEKIKSTYETLLSDAETTNPGMANRIMAQSNALQNIQLGRLDNTQSAILRLMAVKQLNHHQSRTSDAQTLSQSLVGISNLFNNAPRFLK